MNIFYLDNDPVECAKMHLDKHCVKMILEYAQLLSTAHRILDGDIVVGTSKTGRKQTRYVLPDNRDAVLYSATHVNHPSAVWVRQSDKNYQWLYTLFRACLDEYQYRYKRTHATSRVDDYLRLIPNSIPKGEFTDPTPAMPDECKVPGNHLESYKRYYIDKKADMAKWTDREPPTWFIEGIKNKDAYVQLSMQELRSQFRKDSKNGRPKKARIGRVSTV